MTPRAPWRGGVIAAGEGTRLGTRGPKALAEVGGRSLLEGALARFAQAGIHEVVVIVREEHAAVAEAAPRLVPGLEVRVLRRSTPSSAASFVAVREALGPGPAVLSTVDGVGAPDAVRRLVERAASLPEEALVLGVTRHVDDEKPLRVSWTAEGRVTSLGGEAGDGVTAGFYVAPLDLVAGAAEDAGRRPLRALLGAWVAAGRPTWAVDVGEVLDVDRPADLAAARARAATGGPR